MATTGLTRKSITSEIIVSLMAGAFLLGCFTGSVIVISLFSSFSILFEAFK